MNPPAFTRWMLPVGLTLLFLKGLGPMTAWRRSGNGLLRRRLPGPALLFAVSAAVLWAVGVRKPPALLTFSLCAFVLGALLQEIVDGVRLRRRATGADPFSALAGLFSRNRRRYGGYLTHVGVALMFIGFGGSAYKIEKEFQLARGRRAQVGDYTLRYDGATVAQDEQKHMTIATLSVYQGEERLGTLRPARWVYFKHEAQPSTKVDIRRTLKEDLFVALGSYEPQSQMAAFKGLVNPLVNWIWIGFLVMCLGSVLALVPRAAHRPAPAPVSHEQLLEEELRKLD